MKQLTSFIALLLISFNSFADDTNQVAAKVKTSFDKSFPDASDVKWNRSGTIYFGTFKVNDQDISVVYNEDGELKSSSRKLSLSRLPLKVLFAVQDRYSGYNISKEVSEVFSNDESGYLINVENEKNKLALRVDPLGNITVEDKTKK